MRILVVASTTPQQTQTKQNRTIPRDGVDRPKTELRIRVHETSLNDCSGETKLGPMDVARGVVDVGGVLWMRLVVSCMW